MYIGILDDDEKYSTILKNKLTKYGENTYHIYHKITNDIYEENFDIFFLDVMLEDRESFEFGEKLLLSKPNIILVYISNINHFVYKSIHQDSFFFVRKTNDEEDLDAFFNKYRKKLSKQNQKITFVSNKQEHILLQKNILYIEAERNSVHIHTANHEYVVYKSLISIYTLLNHDDFYKLNSYIIVHLGHIKLISSRCMKLDNQKEIPLTRGSKKYLFDAYVTYKGDKLWNG